MIIAVLLALAGRTLADNLTVEAVTMSAGETKEVTISLNNPTHKYAAFQFDLVLPEGISIAKNAKGKLIASLDEDRKDDHTLNVSEMGSNTYRFLSFSMTNTEFYGTDGAIVHLTLQADGNIGAGKRTAVIQSQVFTKTDGEQTKWNDKTFSLEIEGSGGPEEPEPPVVGDDMLTVEQVGMSEGETKQVVIGLNNPTHKYAAFQFDLVLPEGVSIAKNAKGKLVASLDEDRKDDHTLNVSEMGSNTYRFLSFSMTNTEFYGTDGAIVHLTLQADGNIGEGEKTATIQSQVFTEVSGEQYKWIDKTFPIQIQPAVVPEITADDKTRVYGEDNPALTYQTSNPVTGTPILTTTATKTSPVGEYDVVVGKGTVEGNYTAKNGKLTITKAPLTITAKSYTRKQGEENPTFEVDYEGWKNSETEAVLTKLPTVSCKATAESEPGEYDITVSGGEAANYAISYVVGKLTVTEADAVVVTAKSYTREYGEANPTFEYEVSGAQLDGEPVITCEATAASPVGEYDIVVSKGTVKNYNDKYVAGKLTITKAPLTITAKSYTRKQGEENPTFEVGYEGWKNGESENVLTKLPTVSCEATAESEPGEYVITVSGAEAGNYDMTYVAGTLVVTERPSYTLTYLVDGEIYKSLTIKEGATIISEATPTKEGYTFSGWSEIPATMPAKDVTVSGSFAINSYKLTYMIDNKVYKETTLEYDAAITPETQPEGDYLTFEWVDLPETMPAKDVVVHASYTTGIVEALMAGQRNVRIYSPNGRKRDKLQKGLNIVVFDDGTVHKVVK